MDERLKEVMPILEKNEQIHLIQFYDELEEYQKESLINQIKNTNFEFISKLYINSFKNTVVDYKTVEPLPYYSKTTMPKDLEKKCKERGRELISQGKVAVITLAGGCGSRLGFRGPKGTYKLDLPLNKTLFEVLCDKLKNVYEKYGMYLNWYIMTSPGNADMTKEFFEVRDYFGYPKEKIYFFNQHTIDIVNIEGKIILDSIYTLRKDSNGNGDVFKSFIEQKLDKTLENIEWLTISGVDNILLDIIDPIFFGLADINKSSVAAKSVQKQDITDKQWIFAKKDGRPDIINPVYLPARMLKSKNEQGFYNYGQMNILSHLFSKEAFLKSATLDIPYHRAFKKSNYINEEGMKVAVSEPNSFKFEKFIFDVFKHFEKFTLLEVDRSEEFSPIKSFNGDENPEKALEMYLKKNKDIL